MEVHGGGLWGGQCGGTSVSKEGKRNGGVVVRRAVSRLSRNLGKDK